MARISKEMTSLMVEGESDTGRVRFLQIRDEMPKALESGKYPIRVDITWQYKGDNAGLPDEATTREMEVFEQALIPALEKTNLALQAYQVTGEDQRLWCFYTRNINAFQETLNEALADLPLYPLSFYAEEDTDADAFKEVFDLL
ncbi:MAG: DUF695 domain-containing protein [Porphyromonas sp.]|nr:DUF695 domain-containing protein [Porphyromonas sp.]